MSFSGSIRKKNPYQKHQEQQEAKKKRADLEAAKLYDDFVESFGGEDAPSQTAFVTGGTIQPGSRPGAGPAKKSSKYVPAFMPPAMAAAMAAVKDPQPQESVFALPEKARGTTKKPRQIDLMLENLKKGQQERAERIQTRREMGLEPEVEEYANADDNDPFTTNLYVGNLAPDVDEDVLLREFGRFGPVASVKIMWPRDEDQRRRGRNCGFVAFMSRGHAQRARDELDGVLLHDQDLKLGWGKAVTLPSRALNQSSGMSGSAPMASKAGAAVPPPGVDALPPWSDPHAAMQQRGGSSLHHGNGPDITVPIPADGRQRFVIDTVAAYVLRDGPDFEQALMDKETANPEFAFMFNLQTPEHVYFRWRLFSLAQGDTARNWRVEPFVMVDGGQCWMPPPMTLLAGSGSHQTAAQRGGELQDKEEALSEVQRDRFEDLLRGLTAHCAVVRDAMTFCLDNSACATEVVDILTESLTLAETPIPTKVARLFLVSDILHNSQAQVRNASRLRARLESALPDIFDSLHSAYRGADGRMAQEGLRRHVLRVLRVWRSWFIFGDDFLNGLQAMFLRSPATGAAAPSEELAAELAALSDEALESRCRRSGVSSKDGRQAQVKRLAELQAYMSSDQDAAAHRAGPSLRSPADFTHALAAAKAAAAATSAATPSADRSSAGADLAGNASGTAQGPVQGPEAAQKAPPKPRFTEPVSRWTELDDDETAVGAGMPLSPLKSASPSDSDNIFGAGPLAADAATPPAAAGSTVTTQILGAAAKPEAKSAGTAGIQRSPSPELPLPAAPSPAGLSVPDSRSGVQRSDAAEKEHHERMRRVELAVMVFKEELEDRSGLSKQTIADQVRLKRAQLTVEAERAERAAAAAAAEKTEKTRTHDSIRDAGRSVKRDRSRDRSRDRGRKPERSRDRSRSGEREAANSRSLSSRYQSRDRERERERDRDRDRGSGRDRSRSRGRRRSTSRERERATESRTRRRDSSSKYKDSRRSRSKSRSPRKASKRRR